MDLSMSVMDIKLVWARIVILSIAAVFLPLFTPGEYTPIDPLVRALYLQLQLTNH